MAELAGIEGFDEELAEELQNRAIEALERQEEAHRATRRELGVEDALAEIPHLNEAMLVTLGKEGIKTERKSVVEGKSVAVRVGLGGSRIIKKTKKQKETER